MDIDLSESRRDPFRFDQVIRPGRNQQVTQRNLRIGGCSAQVRSAQSSPDPGQLKCDSIGRLGVRYSRMDPIPATSQDVTGGIIRRRLLGQTVKNGGRGKDCIARDE